MACEKGNITPSLVFTDEQFFDRFGFVKSMNPTPLYHYHYGTINGIYAKVDNGKDIIAIFNDEQHNGQFDMFLDALEEYVDNTGEKVAICAFFNEDLYWHLRNKRKYGNMFSTMDRLEVKGKNDAERARKVS